jgi:peptidoglycan/LPS O-acetylase OafA/YrhL
MLPMCHADGLILGCSLAYFGRSRTLPKRWGAVGGWTGLVGLIAFSVFWVQGKAADAIYYGGFTLIGLAAVLLLNGLLVEDRALSRVFRFQPLVAIGRVSYGLYLWHVMILVLLLQHTLGLSAWPRVTIGLLLSALATTVSWFLVEKPALRLKERFGSRNTLEAAPAIDVGLAGSR